MKKMIGLIVAVLCTAAPLPPPLQEPEETFYAAVGCVERLAVGFQTMVTVADREGARMDSSEYRKMDEAIEALDRLGDHLVALREHLEIPPPLEKWQADCVEQEPERAERK